MVMFTNLGKYSIDTFQSKPLSIIDLPWDNCWLSHEPFSWTEHPLVFSIYYQVTHSIKSAAVDNSIIVLRQRLSSEMAATVKGMTKYGYV